MRINDITLILTCSSCPEQYDAFTETGKQVGYLRLRHGCFTVEFPDVGGELIYEAFPEGDGSFTEEERLLYLHKAVEAINSKIQRGVEDVD